MSHTQAPGSDERWAQAFDMANGVVDEERLQQARRKTLIWLTVGAAVCAAVGVAAGIYLLQRTDTRPVAAATAEWTTSQVIGFLLSVTGIVMMAAGFMWAKRTGRYITRWRSVIGPLNFHEQQHAQKQVAGKTEVDADKMPVLVALARQNQRVGVGTFPILNGTALSAVGVALVLDNTLIWFLQLAVATGALGLIATTIVAYRRAERFLARYDATPEE